MLAVIPEALQGRRSAPKLIGLDNLISHLGWEWYHFSATLIVQNASCLIAAVKVLTTPSIAFTIACLFC